VTDGAQARPMPVTVAGWLVVGGSVGVVLGAFAQVAGLQSLATREAVQKYLSEPPGNALDLGVHDVLDIIRVLATVAAACAAATAVLGYQVLQRSRGARVAVTVLSVPMFFTGLVAGGIAAALVAAAVVMLWFQPARGWFDGGDRGGGTRPPI
jgi:hypothetical protein